MRSFLVASLSSLFLATASLSGCASGPAGDEGASAVSEIEDGSVSMAMVGDYRPADGGYPRLLLEADGSYFYDTGVRCFRAPCPSGDAGTWQIDWYGDVSLVSNNPTTLGAERFALLASNDPVTLLIDDANGGLYEISKFVEPSLVGDYRPAGGGYPRLLLEADGSYFYDTGVRCIQAPCPSVDAGSWHLGVDGTVRLVASSPDALEAQRSIEITSNDPVTLAVGDAGAEPHELTPFVEVSPTASCSAVLCAPGRRCEIIDNAAQCVL
jgi:hypothetical protein